MPELNLLEALREFSFQDRQVLNPIDRYNVVGACQIAFVEGARAANFGYKRDTARGQARESMLRDRPDIVYSAFKCQAAGGGLPVETALLGKVIEQ